MFVCDDEASSQNFAYLNLFSTSDSSYVELRSFLKLTSLPLFLQVPRYFTLEGLHYV